MFEELSKMNILMRESIPNEYKQLMNSFYFTFASIKNKLNSLHQQEQSLTATIPITFSFQETSFFLNHSSTNINDDFRYTLEAYSGIYK